MNIKIEKMDLFETPRNYYLAHCISGDFALGAGIAKIFSEKFNMKNRLEYYYSNLNKDEIVGTALLVGDVFNLVTKERCYYKPTYSSLRKSLEDMRETIEENGIEYLAMPKIGCGLDKLSWDVVYEIIKDVFKDTNLNILICDYN